MNNTGKVMGVAGKNTDGFLKEKRKMEEYFVVLEIYLGTD